jgi:hypothetical protein
LIYKVHLSTKLAKSIHLAVEGESKTLCGNESDFFVCCDQTVETTCKACINTKKRREQEQVRRKNGTNGRQASILQSKWFSPR